MRDDLFQCCPNAGQHIFYPVVPYIEPRAAQEEESWPFPSKRKDALLRMMPWLTSLLCHSPPKQPWWHFLTSFLSSPHPYMQKGIDLGWRSCLHLGAGPAPCYPGPQSWLGATAIQIITNTSPHESLLHYSSTSSQTIAPLPCFVCSSKEAAAVL